MFKTKIVFTLCLTVCGLSILSAAESVDDLLKKSETLSLSNDPYWHILLHYDKMSSGFESEVDDPVYFLAPDGKNNPKGELEATIRTIFSNDGNSKAVRFTARYVWLKEKLGISESKNDLLEAELAKVKEQYTSVKMTVLFADECPGTVGSTFGHAFLAVYPLKPNDMRALIVNYAGKMGHDSYAATVYKGLTGKYQGFFTTEGFWSKVNGYGDHEKRAVWEYDLNCTSAEIYRMMLHLHELEDVYCDFYFLSENCSQKLLALMQTARPETNITVHSFYLMPLATVSMLKEKGFISKDPVLVYDPDITDQIAPDKRHGSSRISVAGIDGSLGRYAEVSFMPLYNSMYDENPGLKPGFQLEMLSGAARYEIDDKKFTLERISLFDMMVLDVAKPSGSLMKARLGVRRYDYAERRPLAFNTRFGYGYFYYSSAPGLLFASLDVDVNMYRQDGFSAATGPGVCLGISRSFFAVVKETLTSEVFYYPGKNDFILTRFSAVTSVNLSRYCTINLNGSTYYLNKDRYWETTLGGSLFF
jgi:hypothetical protein